MLQLPRAQAQALSFCPFPLPQAIPSHPNPLGGSHTKASSPGDSQLQILLLWASGDSSSNQVHLGGILSQQNCPGAGTSAWEGLPQAFSQAVWGWGNDEGDSRSSPPGFRTGTPFHSLKVADRKICSFWVHSQSKKGRVYEKGSCFHLASYALGSASWGHPVPTATGRAGPVWTHK